MPRDAGHSRVPRAAFDLKDSDPQSWIPERDFVRYVQGKFVYQFTGSFREAKELVEREGAGEAWTEHSGEANSLFYQLGPGFVDVLGYLAVLPKEATGHAGARIYWGPKAPRRTA
jgi:hypothetical protein